MYNIFLSIFLLMVIILIVNYVIVSVNYMFNLYKIFECGFDSFYWTNTKISIHFFKMGMIFILFDLELMLLFLSFTKSVLLIWLLIIFIYGSIFLELMLKGFKWAV